MKDGKLLDSIKEIRETPFPPQDVCLHHKDRNAGKVSDVPSKSG